MWKKYCFGSRRNGEINYYNWFLKVKIEIFSFVILPSPNNKKNHPKWDLGKDFSSQAFIERWKIKIRAFPRTSRKRFSNGRAIDWRLRDVNVGLQAGKKFCQSFCTSPIAGLRRAFLCVYRVCLSLREFWLRLNEMHEVRTFALCEVFLFVCFENYFGFRTTNVKGKTDHSVSLRWNKRFWTFLKRRVFFWLCIRLLYELISPGWIKTRLYSVISSYGYFFLHSQIYILPLQNHLYPSLQSKNLANACEWTNLCA